MYVVIEQSMRSVKPVLLQLLPHLWLYQLSLIVRYSPTWQGLGASLRKRWVFHLRNICLLAIALCFFVSSTVRLRLIFRWSIHILAPAPLLAFVFSFLLAFLRSLLVMLPTARASAFALFAAAQAATA
jgi:hypothetical protein